MFWNFQASGSGSTLEVTKMTIKTLQRIFTMLNGVDVGARTLIGTCKVTILR